MRAFFIIVAALMTLAMACAETMLSDAKVIKVDDRGFVLQVGTQPLAVEHSYQTRFWKAKASVKRDAFAAGDLVWVRVKTDADPPQLREMADRPTAVWLDSIRKGTTKGVVAKLDAKFLTLKLDDGSTFDYRATDSTKVSLQGKAASLADVRDGITVYAKGRLLPTLDTFLVELSDSAPPPVAAKEKKSKVVKLAPLQAAGSLEGQIVKLHPEISMFDLETDRLLHITFTPATKFTVDGAPANKDALRLRMRAKIGYKRDKAGRIIASKVDLFTS